MVKIVYVGFGIVSQGLAEIILRNNSVLPLAKNLEIQTVGILDSMKGSHINADGIDMQKVLTNANNGDYSLLSENILDIPKAIQEINADIIIEASFTDIKTGQPAISHIETALNSDKHVVTTNKGPFAVAYEHIFNLAKLKGKTLAIEGTVMSGTPIINVLNNGLLGSDITAVSGIMNGTSNYILSKMELGMSYNDALSQAQKLGYAEADPTSDVEGLDTLAKVIILANVVFDVQLIQKDIAVKGISKITLSDVKEAAANNKRWKLIGSVWKDDKGIVHGSVCPKLISMNNSLYGISDATNALKITSSILGDTTIVGSGAGKIETGFALYNDIISIVNR
ncbi:MULTISPECIES: homoserine dehydrogenase [unclassified Polaribacter]|uniref:homoserine dehydrogenase n=1 Tax=unclassified Polaribacter TaxID=196858 RepID=UPI0011BE6B88|nr:MULTISPECIES: homoserine dehydrogenase [unclassified Polaribacter]TXD50722.1 homoserine dehydrogenase [Polaribacter sp. IC063]TXD58286.1 homoserine dehydrogenase [Polaribacter sp. IC066]